MNTAESRSTPQVEPAELQVLVERFKAWRADRPWGQRIPVELWQAAVESARQHGVTVVARALQVDGGALQRRLQSGEVRGKRVTAAPVFVEIPSATLPSGGGERSRVELIHAGGSRLIWHPGDAGAAELLAVMQMFLEQDR